MKGDGVHNVRKMDHEELEKLPSGESQIMMDESVRIAGRGSCSPVMNEASEEVSYLKDQGDKVSRTSLSVTETLPDLQSPSQMSLKAGGGSDRESGSRETLTATPTPQTADISEESEPREKVNDKENEESIDDERV